MNDRRAFRSAIQVTFAVGTLVVLAGLLGTRILAKQSPTDESIETSRVTALVAPAPRAEVSSPRPIAASDLPAPACWACSPRELYSLDIRVDLDLLAPLGNGTGNAAEYFRDFAKADGERFLESAQGRVRAEVGGRTVEVFPPTHPILLEAEGWVDQARCSFYPEIWEVESLSTPIPNLIHLLTLARSWIARGDLAVDRSLAKEDYRRTLRLGRLLLQDDATLIQELIGHAAIRLAAGALYREAQREGDTATMAAAAIVLGDSDAIRMHISQRMTYVNDVLGTAKDGWGGPSLAPSEDQLAEVVRMARTDPERIFRAEAAIVLGMVREFGSGQTADQAASVLEELARNEDEFVSRFASWFLEDSEAAPALKEMVREQIGS